MHWSNWRPLLQLIAEHGVRQSICSGVKGFEVVGMFPGAGVTGVVSCLL